MSVWLSVGHSPLAQEELASVNTVMRAVGLPEHQEPDPSHGAPWTWEIGGYGCFYHLRRIAAYVARDQGLPKPTMDFEEVWEDPVLQSYYLEFSVDPPRRGRRLVQRAGEGRHARQAALRSGRSGSPFAHLMHHTAEFGYYVPIRFPEVVVSYLPMSGWEEPIGIGSSYALQQECAELAHRLQIPADVGLETLDQLRLRADDLVKETGWERFALECFVCKALMTGAEISIPSGCALTFG